MSDWKTFALILSVTLLIGVVMVSYDNKLKHVDATEPEVYEIRVPKSFGNTVSISVDGTMTVILFEHGIYRAYALSFDKPYKIVWEES